MCPAFWMKTSKKLVFTRFLSSLCSRSSSVKGALCKGCQGNSRNSLSRKSSAAGGGISNISTELQDSISHTACYSTCTCITNSLPKTHYFHRQHSHFHGRNHGYFANCLQQISIDDQSCSRGSDFNRLQSWKPGLVSFRGIQTKKEPPYRPRLARTEKTEGDSGASKKAKKKLEARIKEIKEDILTVPNLLTTLRIAASPLLGYLVLHEAYTWGLGLFICAGITDLLDGYIARNFENQTSVLGSVIDPLADKLLIMILMISLSVMHLIPVPLTVLIVARDVGLIGCAFYIRYISLPPPKTLARYFDITFATAKLLPSNVSKVNTALQLSLVAFTLASPVFGFVDHQFLHVLWYLTGITTITSGVGYVLNRNSSFKILKQQIKKKKS